MKKTTTVFILMGLFLISSAFAIPESVARTQCMTATENSIILPDGAYGYVPVMTTYKNKNYINYQMKLLKNNDDFSDYVNANIDKYEMTFFSNENGKTCVVVGKRLSDDADIYSRRDNANYKSLAKINGFESLRVLQKPIIEPTVEKEPYRAPIRTLYYPGNNAENWLFGFNPNNQLFGSNVVTG